MEITLTVFAYANLIRLVHRAEKLYVHHLPSEGSVSEYEAQHIATVSQANNTNFVTFVHRQGR